MNEIVIINLTYRVSQKKIVPCCEQNQQHGTTFFGTPGRKFQWVSLNSVPMFYFESVGPWIQVSWTPS